MSIALDSSPFSAYCGLASLRLEPDTHALVYKSRKLNFFTPPASVQSLQFCGSFHLHPLDLGRYTSSVLRGCGYRNCNKLSLLPPFTLSVCLHYVTSSLLDSFTMSRRKHRSSRCRHTSLTNAHSIGDSTVNVASHWSILSRRS